MNSPEVEKAILGSCMLSQEACAEVCAALKAEDFEYEIHRLIYAGISFLHSHNTPVDLISLSDRLEGQGLAEATGDVQYLSELCQSVTSTSFASEHIHILRQRSSRRKLQTLLQANLEGVVATSEVEDQISGLIADLTGLMPKEDKDIVSSADAVDELMDYIQSPALPTIKTGFRELDYKTGGLRGGELILLAGRPGMGKTAMAQSLALNIARNEHRVIFLECEMSPMDLSMRWISMLSKLPLGMIRNKDIKDDADMDRFITSSTTLSQMPIDIVDASGWTVSRIRAKLLQEHSKRPIDAVVIDYLQLLQTEKNNGNTNDAVADQSKRLKMLARELDVPIILLSQLNRSVESREDKRPRLSDLRDSGAIEQDADAVMFLYRGHVYDEDIPADKAELNVAKLRNGQPGTIPIRWNGSTTSYHDV